MVINLYERAHNNYAKFHYNHHRKQLVSWPLVTWSLVTWSLSHLVKNLSEGAHNNYAKFHYNRISSLWTHRGQTNKQTYLSFPSCVHTNKSEGFPTREQATYSCPCEKHGFCKFSPHTYSDVLVNLVLCWWSLQKRVAQDIANVWTRTTYHSVRIIGMRGNSTSSPLNFTFKIVASFIIFFTGHVVTGHLVTYSPGHWSLADLVTWW
jgi:hypothetical protein